MYLKAFKYSHIPGWKKVKSLKIALSRSRLSNTPTREAPAKKKIQRIKNNDKKMKYLFY
jgi:hypothetical protein